ncbi:MAG: phage Riley [Cyanobacteriota bacterium]|jgi:hypothetical protein
MNISLKERIESHILYSDSCWLTDLFCRDGLPMITVKGRGQMSVPRLYYQLTFNVQLEWNQLVLHTCGNKGCVNPEHLYVERFEEHFKSQNKKLGDSEIEQIKVLLKEGGITQREIAQKFEVSESIISRIKNGNY